MLAASTTKTAEYIFCNVITALHRDLFNGIGHVLNCHFNKAFGNLFRALAVLWTQSAAADCSRVVGYTFVNAVQNPNAPSPIASFGSVVSPRRLTSSSNSRQDSSL